MCHYLPVMALRLLGVLAVFALLTPLAAARAETRVALVVGESVYRNVTRLPNAVADAEATAAALRKVGFKSVQVALNVDKAGFEAALQAFAAQARTADVAMVYYAGHGVEVGGTNYLIPTSARLAADSDVQFEAISLDLVLSAVSGAKTLKIVVLDACRDNPFVVNMKRSSGTRSVGRGLARVEPDAGTLVAYAAREGSTAADGSGGNSPFTRSFIQNLTTPGLEIRLMFGKIHDDVLDATARKQEPAVYASLGGKPFYFVPGTPDSRPPTANQFDPKQVELAYWNSVANASDPALYEAYLKAYPAGSFVALAQQKIASLRRTSIRNDPPAGSRLDGAWTGRYAYTGSSQSPVQFALLLTVNGNQLSGSISEPNTFGDPQVPFLRASIQGTITGTTVRFTKNYDGSGGQSHAVTYVGTIDEQTGVIRGQWRIGDTGGPFDLRLKSR
jgi:hypothetical protein